MARFRRTLYRAAAVASLALPAASPTARADFFTHFWEDRYQPEAGLHAAGELSRTTTSANFETGGAAVTPGSLDHYARNQVDVELSWGQLGLLDRRLTAYGRASWAQFTLVDPVRGGSSSGFVDQSLGLNVRVWDEMPSIDLQVQGDLPTYDNLRSFAEGTPPMGDQSYDFTTGVFLGFPLAGNTQRPSLSPSLKMTAGAGYTYRSDDFSAALPYSLLADGSAGPWSAELGVLGMISLKTDPRSGFVTGSIASISTGGSYVVGAINPSVLDLRVGLGYGPADWPVRLSASFVQGLWGENAPKTTSVSIGVAWASALIGGGGGGSSPAGP